MRAYSLLDSIVDNHGGGGPVIIGENHDVGTGRADSHHLNVVNGRVSMMAAGVLPWHGLGVLVKDAVTSADAIRLAGLDWEVIKTALQYPWAGGVKDATGCWGVVRQDTGDCLGQVGERYKCIQNSEGFAFLDACLERYGARYEAAGALFGGRKVWMLARMPKQSFTLGNNDAVDSYALFTTSHDASEAAYCYPTTVRVVCNNTYVASMGDRSKGISIRHSGSIKTKMDAGREALGYAVKGLESFRQAAEVMRGKRLEVRPYAANVLDQIIGVSEARDVVRELLTSNDVNAKLEADRQYERAQEKHAACLADVLERYHGEGCSIAEEGSAWRAFNAVTEHADHNTLGRQAKDLTERRTRRFESSLNGPADELKQLAYVKAMA